MPNRWSGFTDDEIYVLKRHAIEASPEIMMSGLAYDSSIKELHNKLLNEVVNESANRTYPNEED